MGDVLFLALRRLRAPLISVICVYAITIAGLTLIPGMDATGNAAPLSFFHAFYVTTYTATSLGFGEIPNPFTDAQRLWITLSIYLSVVAWAYSLGTIIALTSDATFRAMLARSVFNWRARGVAEPFYLICGYGQSGAALARALDGHGARVIVIEPRPERVAHIVLEDYVTPPLAIAADARIAGVLEDCGIRRPHCAGLIALAGDDAVNLAIAIGARVLNPELPIVARAKSHETARNLAAFEGVRVLNPFTTFAENLHLAISAPEVLRAEEWLTAAPGTPCPALLRVPRGRWVLAGFGRFGHAIGEVLDAAGIEWSAFDPQVTRADGARLIRGGHTEEVLREAGIEQADVLVAGAALDAINLGITMLARHLRPDLFVVIRQNHAQDRALIEAAHADVEFVQAGLIVHESLQILYTPMLGRFIAHLRKAETGLAQAVITRVHDAAGEGAPLAWTFECDVMQAGMFGAFFQSTGAPLCVGHLRADPVSPEERLLTTALMLERAGEPVLLPDDATVLKPGDRILFVGDERARHQQARYLYEPGTVTRVCSGQEPPRSALFRWWQRRAAAGAGANTGTTASVEK